MFDNMDLINNTLIITNEDGSVTCIPEQDCTQEEAAMFQEFRQAFPDGKPKPEIAPQEPIKSDRERISDLELLVLQLGGVI